MKVDSRLLIAGSALAVIICLIGASYLLNNGGPAMEKSAKTLDETFHASNFTYGPQAWAPYSYALPVVPGSDPTGDNNFLLMFVDLNVTSRANGSASGAGPAVIDYSFKGLKGVAAFHLYGYNNESGRAVSWRSRPDGSSATGYYVFGQDDSGKLAASGNVLDNFNYVKVANANGPAHDDYGNGTYYINFNTPGKGLNALKLSATLAGSGEVTCTTNQTGRFYVTYDSGNGFDDVLLMVAVNGTISDDFELHLTAGY